MLHVWRFSFKQLYAPGRLGSARSVLFMTISEIFVVIPNSLCFASAPFLSFNMSTNAKQSKGKQQTGKNIHDCMCVSSQAIGLLVVVELLHIFMIIFSFILCVTPALSASLFVQISRFFLCAAFFYCSLSIRFVVFAFLFLFCYLIMVSHFTILCVRE